MHTHTHTQRHTHIHAKVSEHTDAKQRCIEVGLLDRLLEAVRSPCPHVRRWACLCAGQLWESSDKTKERALYHLLPQKLGVLLSDCIPEVRAWPWARAVCVCVCVCVFY